ncbi:hypothetical protein L3X38_032867 [Prunus dulcis]|uniref:Uncharacterized protein n=1 Tax=Prunus dulcis TaxID=3755 RepID=A0AAD4VEX5_PRUDU|nr:hypothetical protein L3X38_032867 [Prunus dulcis]
MPSGGLMNPPSIPKVSVAGDKEGSASVEKQEVEEVQLESCSVGPVFFYKLIDDTEWISSRHLDMATFLIRKRQLSHPLVFGTHWTTANYCLQQFQESVKGPAKKRGSKKAAASNTIHLPPSNLNNIHHYVLGTWQHEYGQAWTKVCKLVKYLHPISDTLARVLYEMHFYDASEVEEVKQKGMKMSTFTPFTICSIGDVPQQRDGTSYGIMTVKFNEYLSAGISLDKFDPLKIKYYQLKLAILKGEAYI